MRSGQTFVCVIMGRTGIGLFCLYLYCSTPTSLGQLVNVARGKTCSQSTYFDDHPSSFAVNGKTSNDYFLPNCIHTADYDYTPWFQVDLGRKYVVYNVTLWARKKYIYRLYPLTITVDGQLCVRAYDTGSMRQSLTCSSPMYGQVVRLTRDYDREKNNYLLNLCEVQIWCCNAGWYGDRCDTQCSTKTPRCTQCVQDGGQCTECSGHFQPPQCTDCEHGYYRSGSTCVRCSRGCRYNACDPYDGTCLAGCGEGYYTSGSDCVQCSSDCKSGQCDPVSGTCTQVCKDGYYRSGSTCVQCSSNCKNGQCDPVSGTCTQGCNTGWYGDRCDTQCFTKTPRCTQCVQDGGRCTECSGHFQPPQCTDCEHGYYRLGSTCVRCNRGCKYNDCDPNTGICLKGCQDGYYRSGSTCVQCSRDCKNNQCDPISGGCTQGCKDGYYTSGSTCVQCSSNCKSGQCDPVSGRCTQGCGDGYYNMSSSTCVQCNSNCNNDQCDPVSGRCTRGCMPGYHGDQCNLPCSTLVEGCSQCTQDGNCAACTTGFKPLGRTETLEDKKESLVGPVVAAVVGFIVGMGVMAIIFTAVVCWRRKSSRNAGNPSATEMSSSAPAKNLNDSAIAGAGPPLPASSTAGDAVNVYEIVENDDTTNSRIWRVAPPPSTSAAGVENNVYENEVKENNYDKLCPYSNDDGDRQPYTDIAHVSSHTSL